MKTVKCGVLKFWTLFIGIGAVWGAAMMWIDPTGKMWGMDPLLLVLQTKMPWPEIFFANLISSGFVLLFVNGLTQLGAYVLLRKKHRFANFAVMICGIILMLWIALEWWIFGFNLLSNIYFIFGVFESLSAGYVIYKRKQSL